MLTKRTLNVVLMLGLALGFSVTAGWATPADGEATQFIYLPFVAGGPPPSSEPQPGDCMTDEEALLIEMINDYRNVNGLADVPGLIVGRNVD